MVSIITHGPPYMSFLSFLLVHAYILVLSARLAALRHYSFCLSQHSSEALVSSGHVGRLPPWKTALYCLC